MSIIKAIFQHYMSIINPVELEQHGLYDYQFEMRETYQVVMGEEPRRFLFFCLKDEIACADNRNRG